MPFRKRRNVGLLVPVCAYLLFFGGGEILAQETGPAFVPNRAWYDQETGSVSYPNNPYQQFDRSDWSNWPNTQNTISTLLTSGDPITLIPHVLELANKYGILQYLVVLTVVFVFQYVRNTQKSALHREEFFHRQLEYSERRTTEDLSRLSVKLGELYQDFRSLQEKFERHSELIRANGELSREIVATMSTHNLAVEKGIGELSTKLDHLTFRRPGPRGILP